jgi:hypothetical protein
LRLTFALNSLVAVDNAAWMLYCREKNITNFDEMIPAEFRPALARKHRELASIPLMSYGVPLNKIVDAVDQGYFLLKVKIGADPDKDGDQDKMLSWDKQRLASIHAAVKDREIPHTANGRIPYYLDANGLGVEMAVLLDCLLESRAEYDEMVKKSWEKFRPLFAKQIST